EMDMEIKGRDLVRGIPRTLRVSSVEIREALQEPVGQIVNALRESLERTPPELAADIVDRGIYMTGGGALLRGLDLLMREVTNLNIRVAQDPLTCVVRGAGKILEKLEDYEKGILSGHRDGAGSWGTSCLRRSAAAWSWSPCMRRSRSSCSSWASASRPPGCAAWGRRSSRRSTASPALPTSCSSRWARTSSCTSAWRSSRRRTRGCGS